MLIDILSKCLTSNITSCITPNDTLDFQYDAENRLIRVDFSNGDYEEYVYNARASCANKAQRGQHATMMPIGTGIGALIMIMQWTIMLLTEWFTGVVSFSLGINSNYRLMGVIITILIIQ